MNARNEKKTEETGPYDDAVLEAGGLPPVDLPAPEDGTDQATEGAAAKLEADAFLEAYYRNQE